MGTVEKRGDGGQQKGTTVWRVIFVGSNFRGKSEKALKINFRGFKNTPIYISRYGDFCADSNDDTTDYFTPCACAQGNRNNNYYGAMQKVT